MGFIPWETKTCRVFTSVLPSSLLINLRNYKLDSVMLKCFVCVFCFGNCLRLKLPNHCWYYFSWFLQWYICREFWQTLTSTLLVTWKSIIRCILVFIHWIIYIFCKSWHFVCQWLNYVIDDFTFFFSFFFQYLFSSKATPFLKNIIFPSKFRHWHLASG